MNNLGEPLIIHSDLKNLRKVERYLHDLFTKPALGTRVFNKIQLCVSEAVVNAIIHGNKNNHEKVVCIMARIITGSKVIITVRDEGEGFDVDNLPDPRSGKNLYRAQGRGVLLIRSYMDKVEFTNGGSTVHMVRYKEKPSFT